MPSRDGLRATTISVTVSSLVAAGSLGVAAVVIARSLGPEGRGVFAASYSLMYLFIIVGSLGIGPGGRRLLALGEEGGGANAAEYASIAKRLVAVQVPAGVVGAFLLLPIFDAGRTLGEQIAFVACCVGSLASLLAREALFGLDMASASAGISALGCISTLAGVLAIATATEPTVSSFLWIYAVAAVGETVMAMAVARRHHVLGNQSVRPGSSGRILSSGRSVLVLLVAQVVATRGDRLVIGAVAGSSALGQYAVAVSVMELLSMASFSLGNVAFHGLASGSLPVATMERARRLTIAGTALAAALLIVVAPWVIRVLFGDEFAPAVTALRVLALASIVYGSYQIDGQHLIASGSARVAAILAVGVAVSMIVGDFLVVPSHGIDGAAWVSVGVFAIGAAAARRLVGLRSSERNR